MNIEISVIDERDDAELHLRESIRIMNDAIRRLHKAGISVDLRVLGTNTAEGSMPILSAAQVDRQKGTI